MGKTKFRPDTVCVALDGHEVVAEFSNVVTARNYQERACRAGFGVSIKKVVHGVIVDREVG